MDGMIGRRMGANQICLHLHRKFQIILARRKISTEASANVAVQSVTVRLIQRTPQCKVFLQRLDCLTHEALKLYNGCSRFPSLAEPVWVCVMMQCHHGG